MFALNLFYGFFNLGLSHIKPIAGNINIISTQYQQTQRQRNISIRLSQYKHNTIIAEGGKSLHKLTGNIAFHRSFCLNPPSRMLG